MPGYDSNIYSQNHSFDEMNKLKLELQSMQK